MNEYDEIGRRRRRRRGRASWKKGRARRPSNLVSPAADRSRAIYNKIKSQNKNAIVTQSYLRLEQQLGTQSQVEFNVLKNEGTVQSTERRLSINDAFICDMISVMLYKVPTGEANGIQQLDTFPNPLVYTGASEAANLQSIYNGFLSIRVNSTVFIDSLDVMRFLRVGNSQEGVDLGGGTGANATGVYQASEYRSANYPFDKLSPTIKLSGSAKNELKIELPASANLAGTDSTNYVVMLLRGLLISDGAKFNTRG